MGAHVTIGGTDYPVIFDAPGEQSNILQQPEGTEPSVMKFYGVIEGDANPDRYITYANLVKLLLSAANVRVGSKVVTAGANSEIFKVASVNTPFSVTSYALIFTKGYELGISDVVKYVDHFTLTSIDAGTIDYIAILFT